MSSQLGVDGLVSGLNTQQIVSQLMRLERQPVMRLEQTRSQHRAADDAWARIATKLQAVQTSASAIADRSRTAATVAVTSSDESAVVATAVPGAQVSKGAVSLTVDRLATASQVASVAEFTSPDDVIGQGTMTIRIAGEDVQIETVDNATVKDLTRIVNDLDQGARAQVLKVGQDRYRLVITSAVEGTAGAVSVVGDHPGVGATETTRAAVDALVTVGGIQVSRPTNQIDDLVDGVQLDLRRSGTGPVTVDVRPDTDAVVAQVADLVDAMNSALSTVGELGATSADADSRGVLSSDASVRRVAASIRDVVAAGVDTGGGVTSLSALGVELTRTGEVTLDEGRLREALETDFDATVELLSRTATTDGPYLADPLSTSATATGSYDVVVTQAATRASDASAGYTAPVADETFTVSTVGGSADVTITAGATRQDAVDAINAAITGAGLALEARADGSGIAIESTRWGSSGDFSTAGAAAVLGGELSGTGQDVAGTIGGEAATGTGQRLRADVGDPAGLSVTVTVDAATLAGAGGQMQIGPVDAAEGFGGQVASLMDQLTDTGGVVDRARGRLERRIGSVDDQIQRHELRLDLRERTLMRQFTAMEQAMGQLIEQGNWLTSQLPPI